MTDNGMKGRVKGLLGVPPTASEPTALSSVLKEPTGAHQALQVLSMAQRTAEEHLGGAKREADRIRSDAQAKAELIVRDAQAQADALAQEADKALAQARAMAERIRQDAQDHADKTQRAAEKVLADARKRGDEMAKKAQAQADDMAHQAQQRYDDVVGSLATRREALQQQIEALEQFEREYRARLSAFMQSQLRALWVDEPRVTAEDLDEPLAPPVPAQRPAEDPVKSS